MRNAICIITLTIFALALSGCQSYLDQEFSFIKIDDNIIEVNPENIEIYFPDGFEINDLSQKTTLEFNSKEGVPEYKLDLMKQQNKDEIIESFQNQKDYLITESQKSITGEYEIIKIIQTGPCQKAYSILVGNQSNLKFSNGECSPDPKNDFEYFDRLILNIKKNDE